MAKRVKKVGASQAEALQQHVDVLSAEAEALKKQLGEAREKLAAFEAKAKKTAERRYTLGFSGGELAGIQVALTRRKMNLEELMAAAKTPEVAMHYLRAIQVIAILQQRIATATTVTFGASEFALAGARDEVVGQMGKKFADDLEEEALKAAANGP